MNVEFTTTELITDEEIHIEFKKRCAETVTIEAPSEEEARKSLNETFRNLTLVELISEE